MGVPLTLVTAAVKVTLSPYVEVFSGDEEVTDVAVAGLLTVNPFVRVAVPPPGVLFVTDTFRAPTVAFEAIVMLAVICVELSTVVEFAVIFVPKFTELTPVIKLVPVKTTFSVCERFPLVGEMLTSVGVGLFTVKVAAFEVPPPGAGLVTTTA